MSSESENEDYMSDKFLETLNDVRPGLINNRELQREVKVTSKKLKIQAEAKIKPIEKERIRLKEGLSSAIASDNKGFLLLQKMGYKSGESLGKKGLIEPVSITIKTGRGGLGREAALKELEEYKSNVRKRKLEESACGERVTTEEFRKRMTLKAEDQFTEVSLRKCQKTCWRLDEINNVLEPEMSWFWPILKETKDNSEEETEETAKNEETEEEKEIEYSTIDKLHMLNSYLRITYCYCHWCGIQYENNDDLNLNCPGLTKDDH